MSTPTEIELHKESTPRFVRTSSDEDFEDPTQIRQFHWKHSPHFGLLNPKAGQLVIPGVPMGIFNEVSIPAIEGVREGDLVLVETSSDDPVYQVWNPAEEFQVGRSYAELFRVKTVATDVIGLPIMTLELAI